MATTAANITKAKENNSSRDKMKSIRAFVSIFLHFVVVYNHVSGEYIFVMNLFSYILYCVSEKKRAIEQN